MPVRRALWGFSILMTTALPGCLVVQVGVTNPIPDLSTVAVVPFFNQSSEPPEVVDGRRFAMAYATELQKVPGFQVLPVGVTETAIVRGRIDLNKPGDVLRLAELLDVDAVVVGSVTHYDPYYPPRMGLHVDWYSRDEWTFRPGIPVVPVEKPGLWTRIRARFARDRCEPDCEPVAVRGQSAEEPPRLRPYDPPVPPLPECGMRNAECGVRNEETPHSELRTPNSTHSELRTPNSALLPLMSYTRLFDGADSDLQATLRDYVEFLGDERSGGWRAYLHRSDDFIRFTSHLMIVEMLTLHGGEAQTKYVLKARKSH
ncbi:MAG: hypothetical protein WED34_14795 [Planctomycetales bacterium]